MTDPDAATAGGGEQDEEVEKMELLEHEFQEFLHALAGDKQMEHFRNEYEKLHKALKKSHESEKR